MLVGRQAGSQMELWGRQLMARMSGRGANRRAGGLSNGSLMARILGRCASRRAGFGWGFGGESSMARVARRCASRQAGGPLNGSLTARIPRRCGCVGCGLELRDRWGVLFGSLHW